MSAYRRQVALGETASAIRRAGRFADSVKFGYLRPGRRVHAAPNRSAQQDYYPWPYHVQVLANPVAIHSPRALFRAEAIRGWSARRGLSPGGKCIGHRRPPWRRAEWTCGPCALERRWWFGPGIPPPRQGP